MSTCGSRAQACCPPAAAGAPGHVAHVRSPVIDVLSPEQLRRLGPVAGRNPFVSAQSKLGSLDTSSVKTSNPTRDPARSGLETWSSRTRSAMPAVPKSARLDLNNQIRDNLDGSSPPSGV